MAGEDRFEGARAVGLVVDDGMAVLLGQLDSGCVGKKRAYYQQNVCRRGTSSSVLGEGRTEMGRTPRSTIAMSSIGFIATTSSGTFSFFFRVSNRMASTQCILRILRSVIMNEIVTVAGHVV